MVVTYRRIALIARLYCCCNFRHSSCVCCICTTNGFSSWSISTDWSSALYKSTENNKLCLLLKIMVVVYAQLEKRNCRKFCLISSILKLSGVRARSGLNANLKDLSSPGVFRAAVRRCLLVGEL